DLSLTLADNLPSFWPGHMPFQRKPWVFTAPKFMSCVMPYQTGWWVIDEHSGTHFDAPIHFIPPPDSELPYAGPAGNISGETIHLNRFHARALVIDPSPLREKAEPGKSPLIEPDAPLAWEQEHGAIEHGDAVLFRSGWDDLYLRGDAGMAYAADVIVGGA